MFNLFLGSYYTLIELHCGLVGRWVINFVQPLIGIFILNLKVMNR